MFTSTCQAIWTWDWPPTVQLLDKRADCLANGRLLSKWTNTTQANPGTPQNCLENQASIFGHFCGTHASQMLGKQSNICDLRFCLQKQSLRIAHNCLENQAKSWRLWYRFQERLGICLGNKAIFIALATSGVRKGLEIAWKTKQYLHSRATRVVRKGSEWLSFLSSEAQVPPVPPPMHHGNASRMA